MCMFPKYSRGYVKGNWHTPRTPFEEWQQVAVGCSGSLGPSIKAIIPSVLDYITENEYTGEFVCYVYVYTLHHNMPLWIITVHVLFSYIYIYAYIYMFRYTHMLLIRWSGRRCSYIAVCMNWDMVRTWSILLRLKGVGEIVLLVLVVVEVMLWWWMRWGSGGAAGVGHGCGEVAVIVTVVLVVVVAKHTWVCFPQTARWWVCCCSCSSS